MMVIIRDCQTEMKKTMKKTTIIRDDHAFWGDTGEPLVL